MYSDIRLGLRVERLCTFRRDTALCVDTAESLMAICVDGEYVDYPGHCRKQWMETDSNMTGANWYLLLGSLLEIRSSLMVYERLMNGDVRRRVSADRINRLAPVHRP